MRYLTVERREVFAFRDSVQPSRASCCPASSWVSVPRVLMFVTVWLSVLGDGADFSSAAWRLCACVVEAW